MKMPEKQPDETDKEYARRMHWMGKAHVYIARKLHWTNKQVHDAVFKEE